jgi:signal transduction histidine kinase
LKKKVSYLILSKINTIPFLLFIFLFSFLSSLSPDSFIENAFIKISENKLYDMRGKWKILLQDIPNGESNDLVDSDWKLINVPSLWSFQGIEYKGIAWIRMHLDISSKLKGEVLGFQVPNILDAHKVYFNGVFIGGSGTIDPTLKNFHHNPKSDFYSISPNLIKYDEENILSIQMQTHLSVGGTANELYFGVLPLVKKEFLLTIIARTAFSISFMVLSIYILFSYFGTKEISNIYGSIVFLCFSLIIITMYQIESWFTEGGFFVYFTLFTIGFGGMYLFQFIFLKKEYGFPILKIEKIIMLIYLIIFLANFIPLFYLPFIDIRNKYLLTLLGSFHLLFNFQTLYYSIKILIQKKFINYPFAIGFILVLPSILQDYLIVFDLRLFHDISSLNTISILLFFYSINLILKQHFFYQKIILMEKDYSVKLEKEVSQKTKDLIQTNDKLIESNNLKNKLFSIISHDLRSPLDALNEVLYLFRNKKLDNKQLKNHILDLSEYLERNQFLLENLLNWSYGQMRDEPLNIEKINLNQILMEVYDIMLPSAEKKSIRLNLQLEGTNHWVYWNRHALNLVMINLINNSIKFTHSEGLIDFGFISNEDNYTIFIKDNGVGIDSERLMNINSEKELTSLKGTNNERGAGIGLKLCNEILNKLGTKLQISSEPEKGSTFTFFLKNG